MKLVNVVQVALVNLRCLLAKCSGSVLPAARGNGNGRGDITMKPTRIARGITGIGVEDGNLRAPSLRRDLVGSCQHSYGAGWRA